MNARLLIAVLGAGAIALFIWAGVRVSRRAAELQDQEMGLLDHLRELRYRVLASLAAVAVATTFLFAFDVRPMVVRGYDLWVPVPSVVESLASRLLDWMLVTSLPDHVRLVVLSPSEAIVAAVQAAVLGGLVLAAPVVAYHVAAFLAPAMLPNERRLVAGLSPVALVLFLAGLAFGFFLMVPLTLETLYAYAEPFGADALAQPQDILSFILLTTALFGVAFELPLVMGGLSYVGLVHPSTMARHWRGVVVALLIVGAVVSDPSPATQVLVAGPIILLYAVGLGVARVTHRLSGRGRYRGH